MADIIAVGDNEFAVGFQLAGIRTMEIEGAPDDEMHAVMTDRTIGIVIIGQKTYDALLPDTKERILQSINPVFVVLSEQESSEELRMLIKKSIGVDLWNK